MDRRKIQNMKPYVAGTFIWLMAIPLLILDIFIEIYHHICFPLYEIPLVKRSKYIKIDRPKLEYLTLIEKVECAYCGYANGLLQYAVQIAGKSEKYWCGIKHKSQKDFVPPKHHADFVEYGDKAAFERKYPLPHKEPPMTIWQNLCNIVKNNITWRHRNP